MPHSASFSAGDPRGDVTIVEFYDPNCPYCRRAAPALTKLLGEDRNLRIVFKELPILGPDSDAVSRLTIASIPQGGYLALYEGLFAMPGRATPERALQLAASLGLDTARLKRDMTSTTIVSMLAENRALADRMGVEGVPSIFVDGKPVSNDSDDYYGVLRAAVAAARGHKPARPRIPDDQRTELAPSFSIAGLDSASR